MTKRMLNIAYVGNGKSANRYHIPFVLARPEQWRVAAIQARHVDHSTWAEVPGARYVTDLDDVLGDPDVDVVEIATPSATHFEMARRALEAGKHVTVDKPFSATCDEAAELFELAESRGVTVQCYQNRRFDSDYLTARKVYESGRLGHVFEIVTTYDYWRPSMLVGCRLDVVNSAAYGHASHCLDQIISWFGVPDRWSADLRQLQGEGMANDYFDFDLHYDSIGVKATAQANYSTALLRPSFALYGDRGAFVKQDKDQQERDLKHFYMPVGHEDFGIDSPEQWGTLRWKNKNGLHEERVETVRSTYSQFYDALYETVVNGAPQLVSPEETLTQMRILEESTSRLR